MHEVSLAIAMAVLGAGVATVAHAQADTSVEQEATLEFDIPSQPLARAIAQLCALTRLQVLYTAEQPNKLVSKAVKGRLTTEQALRLMLEGSGFSFRFVKPDVFTLEKISNTDGARVLGPVRVEGVTGNTLVGANGSSDATATEGTGSYTSNALTIGTKSIRSMQETPQSISVITQQQMQDQNLFDFRSVMDQAVGVARVVGTGDGGYSNLQNTYFSRGYTVSNIQLDGGAPLNASSLFGYVPLMDMAQYDHVELLRGVDGLFNGVGNPGGAINLVRKRPLAHSQLIAEGVVGSWNRRRVMLDGAAPLALDGRLRGRTVLSYEKQDYFYDIANQDHNHLYGILEFDAAESTLLSFGGSYTNVNATPWYQGLPRYRNGDDLRLPRDTCLCLPWSRWDFDTSEWFGQVEQRIGARWTAKLRYTDSGQTSEQQAGAATGHIDPATDLGIFVGATPREYRSRQKLADFALQGSFDLWGSPQQVLLGVNRQDIDAAGNVKYNGTLINEQGSNVFGFDPYAWQDPGSSDPRERYPEFGQVQTGAYATLNLTLFERLHVPVGIRWTKHDYAMITESYRNGVWVPGTNYRTAGSDTARPDLAFSYDVTKQWTTYASYSSIYQLQNTQLDRNHQPSGPVTGSNMQGGVKANVRDGKLNLHLALYRMQQENFALLDSSIPYETSGSNITCCYVTYGSDFQYLSQGVDAEASGEVLPGLQINFGYTYNKNEYRGEKQGSREGQPLESLFPRHLAKLSLNYRAPGGRLRDWSFGLGVNTQSKGFYTGNVCVERRFLETGEQVCGRWEEYDFDQGAFGVWFGNVGYRFGDRWQAALNIKNLTDRTYYETVGGVAGGNWYGEPRSFTLTLRGSF